MAIADDFTIAVNGDIRKIASPSGRWTVIEFHRYLQEFADNASVIGDDLLDITDDTPSERSTDNIIRLINGYNIDDATAEYLYDGSILQGSGDTEELYSGLVVVGSVESGTEIQVLQDGAVYTSFWGTGLNADAAANILLRVMIKTREDGADIDGKRIICLARELGDTYAEFSVTLGLGNSTAALFTSTDLNNPTASGTISTWTINKTEGYQELDIPQDGSADPFYLEYDWSAAPGSTGSKQRDIYEWGKYVGARTTGAVNMFGIDGLLFRGPTTTFTYSTSNGTISTGDELAWGLNITYSSGGAFTIGEAVKIGSGPARGRVLAQNGAATGNLIVAIESGTVTASDTITGLTSAQTATVDSSTGQTSGGGRLLVLAIDTTGSQVWCQLLSGTAPATSYVLDEVTAIDTNDLTTNSASTSITVSPEFVGTSTGANVIGATGFAIDNTDSALGDQFFDLDGVQVLPANTVTFTVTDLVDAEDYVLITNNQAGGIDFDQMTLDVAVSGTTTTSIDVNSIPVDTPQVANLRVELDDGTYHKIQSTSWTGSVFTTAATDWDALGNGGPHPISNNVFIAYYDGAPSSTEASFQLKYNADRTMFIRVRDGGTAGDLEGIKTFETTAALTNTGGGTSAIRTPDA